MEKMKEFWGNLPAQRKKQIVLGTGCAILVSILWQFLSGNEFEKKEYVSPSSVRLTGDNTERLGMDALTARVRSMEQSNKDLKSKISSLEEEKRKLTGTGGEATELQQDYQRQIDRIHERLNRQTRALKEQGIQIDENGNVTKIDGDDSDLGQSVSLLNEDTENAEPIDFSQAPRTNNPPRKREKNIWADSSRFQAPPSRATGEAPTGRSSGASAGEGQAAPQKPAVSMKVIESTPDAATRERQAEAEQEAEAEQYLPAGSIVSGTLITGLDAPTSNSAKGNPHPALVRIKTESILPNRYRADLRECFMIVSGYGDMSSERAYLRTETLSCINQEGVAMETRLESFAVGEDGKAGIRGRLVTKTGQLLAKSTMAAFISSASEVFGSSPIPTISTTASDQVPFQQAMSDEAVQSAAMQGTGKAMERIADYYMDMADQIFPILEIDAGREIDLILNSGTSISFEG